MRDIKFRAWDKEIESFIPVNNWIDELKNSKTRILGKEIITDFIKLPCLMVALKSKDVKLMQCTGLKDIKGLSIYEGDIIEGGYLNPLTNEFLSRKYIVVYDNAEFKGELIGHSPYGDTGLRFIKGYVIGNIYENPELLEV